MCPRSYCHTCSTITSCRHHFIFYISDNEVESAFFSALMLKSISPCRSAPRFDPVIQHSLITVTVAYIMVDQGPETMFRQTVVKNAYFMVWAWKNPSCASSQKSRADVKYGNTLLTWICFVPFLFNIFPPLTCQNRGHLSPSGLV